MSNVVNFPGQKSTPNTAETSVSLPKESLEPTNFRIDADGGIHYTDAGRKHYGRIFGKGGFDIRAIKTIAQHEEAFDACFDLVEAEIFEEAGSANGSLDSKLLAAIMASNTEDVARYTRLIEHRNRLKVVKGNDE